MDRRQAERIRDLQRGHFLGLGPAISRSPVAVEIGSVKTGSKNASEGLMPLPDSSDGELEALLHTDLAQAAAEPAPPQRPAPAPRPSAEIEQAIVASTAVERPAPGDDEALDAASATPAPSPEDADEGLERIVRELAMEDGATFQSQTSLFRNFAVRCRQAGVPSAHVDMMQFRRLFAYASTGLDRLESGKRERIEELAQAVPEDVLAPYLTLAVNAALGRTSPDEDELARAYGSSSPSRIRRLLDHLERQGLIVVREDFGGERTVTVAGLETA